MTREEAIYRLKNMAWLYGSAEREQNIEAIDMAIEALLEKSDDSKSFSDSAEPSIVRCKDCRHWNSETKGCKRNPSVGAWQEDDFCKYGKRWSNAID